MNNLFKPELVHFKDAGITEKNIQDKIADDPSILGLGDLILKDKERNQLRAGRLDLLFQDPDTYRRYEIEIQLGKTDESHLIRTIEYWDIERKRYPQYDHCAVIIAEDITSRFLNVISLFNGFIPLIAIQMKAFKFGEDIGLVFTKVLDEMPLGLVDEDEERDVQQTTTNREFWIKKTSNETVALTDKFLELINENEGSYQFIYTKGNVRISQNGNLLHFLRIRIRKRNHFILIILSAKSDDIDLLIENNGLDDMGYNIRLSRYRIRISNEDLITKKGVLKELFLLAANVIND